MKFTKKELLFADNLYSEYRKGIEVKQVAKMFGKKRTLRFYHLLAQGCNRFLESN